MGPQKNKRDRREPRSGEIYIEFVQQGRFVKVIAIDPVSMLEVSLVGDANEGRERLKQLAVQKLAYVLRKYHSSGQISGGRLLRKGAGSHGGGGNGGSGAIPGKPKRRGIVV